jgi:hypothetical protein
MADLGRAALSKLSKECGIDLKSGKQAITNGSIRANGDTETESATSAPPAPAMNGATHADVTITATMPIAANMPLGNDLLALNPNISPDWLNFDTAFENFDAVLGSSGADVSMELLKPFNFDDDFGSYAFTQ